MLVIKLLAKQPPSATFPRPSGGAAFGGGKKRNIYIWGAFGGGKKKKKAPQIYLLIFTCLKTTAGPWGFRICA